MTQRQDPDAVRPTGLSPRVAGGGHGAMMRAVLGVLFGLGHAVMAVSELALSPAQDAGGRVVGWTSVVGFVLCAGVTAVNARASRSPERVVALRPAARRLAVVALAAQGAVVLVALGSYVRLSDAFPDAVAATLQLIFTTGLAVATWRAAGPAGRRRPRR